MEVIQSEVLEEKKFQELLGVFISGQFHLLSFIQGCLQIWSTPCKMSQKTFKCSAGTLKTGSSFLSRPINLVD